MYFQYSVFAIGEKVGKFVETNQALAHYQFTPTGGAIIQGASTTISTSGLAATEGTNTGSWKGTLGDDNLHWVVAGENPDGLDVNLTLGGVQLNGANKLIVQTEVDFDATVLGTYVQICDWLSNTSVDNAADAQCTGGGWRTLNTRTIGQQAVPLVNTGGTAFQWHIHNGYWSTGITGGTAINTPLTNFVNGSDEIKIRYYSASTSATQIAIDYLRVYPIVDPIYQANGFQKESGGTVTGHYGNTFGIGNTSAGAQQVITTGDALTLGVPGTAATSSNFYLTFGNVKTYTGMNTILVNTESLCSAATANIRYKFKIRNFTLGTWEDISSPIDCSATGAFNNFAKNNITIDDYINGTDEIWVGAYTLSTTTTSVLIDSMYLMLGTTNTDTNTCEITMGSTTAGSIVSNPSTPGADRIQAMTTDGTYMYVAGYDSIGIDNEWRLEKRNLSDGTLVSAFGVGGATTSDPSTGIDQIFAIATTTGAVFTAGYDLAAGAGQWRIEKRDITDGTLETAFDTDGVIQTDPNSGDVDAITAIAVDANYLYATGYQDDDTGIWRTHKYDITTGALVTAFDGDGIATATLAATGDERPQAIKVDNDYLYIAGYDNVPGNVEWRIEKRNKTTGALCASGVECAAGAFGVGGVATSNPSANIDAIYAMAIDDTHIYVAGYDSIVSAADAQWRIEKRDIVTGALVTAFDTDGFVQVNPVVGRIEWATALSMDATYLYIGGYSNPSTGNTGAWRLEKRDKVTGATTTVFSDNGSALSDDGIDDRLNAMFSDGTYIYTGGYGSGPTDNQWLIEKRSTSTGLRVDSGFGGSGDCTSTRDIDTTSDDAVPWNIRAADESASATSSFYGFDSDADGAIEEASAATMEFSTVVPTNAAVAGIHWAGRAMSGSGGIVRLAVRDYSGLTGTTGGRSIIGGSPAALMLYNDPLVVGGVATGGMAGYMTNPEDYVDTVNGKMGMSLVTTSAGASTTNSVSVWDFAMVSFSWVEDADHPSTIYQFTPTGGAIIQGASTTISTSGLAATEGTNTGSWKGTLGDDNLHWVVAGENPDGLDVNLTLGGVQLNGANKLIVQTEVDFDATVLGTYVQICDWLSNTSVDNAADAQCTGGGWRTLNTRTIGQQAVPLVNTGGTAFQWHIHNGYWSTGITGGTAINTPLTNFVNGSDEIKIRYYSASTSATQIAIDYLRVYPIVDPIYQANGFQKESGGTVTGHYGNTFGIGNTSAGAQQVITTGDALTLGVPGTAATSSNFYLTFGNVKTYTGMNTILVNTESLCSAATANIRYKFKIRNFTLGTWEDISSPIDCSATGAFNNFAKNNITIDDYINGTDEIWVGAYTLSTTTTSVLIDSMYLMLGTTNTDTNTCEITMGSTTAGSIVSNPSTPGADRIQAMTTDGTYMYVAGYDSIGIDNEWRLEKRNLSDGTLVSAFGVGGATTSDPSTGIDQIFAIATTTGAVFTAGYDLAAGAGQWRIEKRDITDGTLETAFDTDGVIQTDPNSGDVDAITAIAVDANYLYATGYQDDDTGIWRTHKYDITTGALVTAFDGDGIATATLAATGDERPQAIKVDNDYLYIAGYDNVPGNVEWRIEKRNKTTGALCASGVECAAGAFGVGGVATTNPSANIDAIYAMTIDNTHIYVAGYDSVVSAADSRWRIEKRTITTGALETAFDIDGMVLMNPNTVIDWATSMAVDDTHLYVGGFIGSTAGTWRVEKRDRVTGATTTAFSDNGSALSDDGSDDRLNALALDAGFLYTAGYGSGPADNQWMIEKRATTTGLRVDSGFGGSGDCTSTRDIDTTSDDAVPWNIRAADESASATSSFYGFDSDADGAIEEASAATMEFSTVVPTNAAVAGIHWAGRAMSGSGGIVRLAVRDYSGLTGTTGGRSIIGGSPAALMLYNDPLVVGGVATGGMAGYMTNPEDYVDTVNGKMGMSLVTTSAGASTTNSVSVWDFAMVSFSWVEVTPAPVYSISITSDGTIQYGYLDLNTSSSTVGGDTQTAQNNGMVTEKINVRSSNAIGGISWLLASTVSGDQYTHEFSTTTGASWVSMPDSSTYVAADSLVAPSDTIDFDFRVTAPTGSSDFIEKAITITVQAVAP